MIVFHGSLVVVEKPEIRISNRFLDFGFGFYTTSNYQQAFEWGKKLASRIFATEFYISKYEFDLLSAKEQLKLIEFDSPTREWLHFVCDNRLGKFINNYDVAIGPVADDNIYETVRLFEAGTFDEVTTLQRLKVEEVFNQTSFHTINALKYLKFLSSEEVNG